MEAFQRDFIDFALGCEVLRFGRFVLKSGRESPYFFDCGRFDTGERLRRLAGFYVDSIQHAGIDFDTVYGPAYKGIPLATSVAVELSRRTGRDVPWCFNRKEAKDHGEGGVIVGAQPRGRVLIVDDVVSAGTATRESVRIIRDEGAKPGAFAIALDRRERGHGALSAVQEVSREFGLEVLSIINLDHLVEYLEARESLSTELRRVAEYRERYGVAEPDKAPTSVQPG